MEPDPAPVFVEIFGSPGAGKTTLSRALQSCTPVITRGQLSASWRTRSAAQKGAVLAAALRHPGCAARVGEVACKASLFRRDSVLGLGRLIVKSHWLPSVTAGKLLEEGPLQDIWSILYSSGRYDFDPPLLSPLIASIYRGMSPQIAYIELDARTASRRIAERHHGKSRFDGASEHIIAGQLTPAARLPANIARAAQQAGLRVFTLDGSEPIEALAQKLRSIWETAVGPAAGTEHLVMHQLGGRAGLKPPVL